MNCLEFRRIVGAEPGVDSEALAAHGAACPACARHRDELRAFDLRLRRAMELPLPARAVESPARAVLPRWAAAAGIAAAALVGALLWLLRPAPSLAAEVTAHLAHEPEALTATTPLPGAQVTAVLAQFGLGLRGGLGAIVYAENCEFRGRARPHFVVRAAHGAVTVFLVPEQAPRARERLDIEGRSALFVPVGRGGAVVVGAAADEVDAIARRVDAALVPLR